MSTAIPFWTMAPAHVQLLLLMVARLSGLLVLAPPFHQPIVPPQVRLGLALALALPVWGPLAASPPPLAGSVPALMGLVGAELALGLSVGFVGRLAVGAATFAAELVANQLGFGLASVLDPMQGAQLTVLTRLFDWTMLGLFLALDIHLLMIGAFTESFRLVPPATVALGVTAVSGIVSLAGRMFVIAMALVGPTVAVVFLANLVLVLVGRAMPQLHLMAVGFPITILLGLVVLLLNVDLMSGIVAQEVGSLSEALGTVMRGFAHGR